ncbi:uncharacterized protein LOC143819709 isoform X2 [Paroedura picta]|uniref:uncharacterized protein LOC143819709 isoform X2 n=1 Tax=Paroedura picta TaxID=143630 RepID=UPI004057425D
MMPKSRLKESCRKSKWQETVNGVIAYLWKWVLMVVLSVRNLMKPYFLIGSNGHKQTMSQESRQSVPQRHRDPPMDSDRTKHRKPGAHHHRHLLEPEEKNQKEDPQDKISGHKRSYLGEFFLKKPNDNVELRKNAKLKVFPCYDSCLFPCRGRIRLRTMPSRRLPAQLRAQQICQMACLDRTRNMDTQHHFQRNSTESTMTLAQTQVWPTKRVGDHERRREAQQLLRRLAESDVLIAQLWQDDTLVENNKRTERSPQGVENVPEIPDQVLEPSWKKDQKTGAGPSEIRTAGMGG